jgi:hypothetical protein
MEERWKPCAEFPLYEISTCGNIRHSRLKKLRKFRIWRGYKSVQLRDEANRLRTVTVHRLMAKTFLRGLEQRVGEHGQLDDSACGLASPRGNR